MTGAAPSRLDELTGDLFHDFAACFSDLVTTSFNGQGVPAPATTSITDSFDTRNQFYGGQVGMRASYLHGRFGLDLTGKLALGAVHQTVSRDGSTTLSRGSTVT